MADHFYFGTYARKDYERVHPIIDALRGEAVSVWVETMLQPGQDWTQTVSTALVEARGILFFLSQQSFETDFMQEQLALIALGKVGFVLPILLDEIFFPPPFGQIPHVLAAGKSPAEAAQAIAERLREIQAAQAAIQAGDMPESELHNLADALAASLRPEGRKSLKSQPDSIFIVHGHDLALRDEVAAYLTGLGIKTVILTEIAEGHQSLFQKFLTFSEDVEFAVVLLTADDYGASRRQYDAPGVADRALQFRARQNVILELGFFYGYLGWERVFVLFKGAAEAFPNFEIPSDLAGILFDPVDEGGKWREKLAARLREAGFILPAGD
jgi:predicted nucleotide-binding protein